MGGHSQTIFFGPVTFFATLLTTDQISKTSQSLSLPRGWGLGWKGDLSIGYRIKPGSDFEARGSDGWKAGGEGGVAEGRA